MSTGRPVLIEVDLAGARAVKAALPESLAVFLAPPSWEALESRLAGRGTETAEVRAVGWPRPGPNWPLRMTSTWWSSTAN